MFNTTCNATLDDLRILPTSEVTVVGNFTFHQLAIIIGGACTLIAIVLSFYLIWMHALHYTKPREQKHIIRILFMVPIYAAASFLCIYFYWHYIYYQVISDCYEAFAISSFFALMCHYVGTDLHEQKNYFRYMRPVKNWVWPINWFRKCCGGRNPSRGPWRTPQSGLTWFNIVWIGIYQYCFIRVTMTVTAVVTQYFGKYCESSNLPVFSHIWIIVIESCAVTIAMYCVIQFYIQMKGPLKEHRPFLKVLAIKLVIFLSFWQSAAISVGTSTLNIVHPNRVLAYPDIKVVIPSLLLCFEMACFAVLHLWAFPYHPYLDGAKIEFYPVPDPDNNPTPPKENEHFPRSGGFLGLMAILDAANIWDVVKAFGRGVRWLFVGVRRRHEDVSYQSTRKNSDLSMDNISAQKMNNFGSTSYGGATDPTMYAEFPRQHRQQQKSTDHLPIASQFRSSAFLANHPGLAAAPISDQEGPVMTEEHAALIDNAQPNPSSRRRDDSASPYRDQRRFREDSVASYQDNGSLGPPVEDYSYDRRTAGGAYAAPEQPPPPQRSGFAQASVHEALYGPQYGQAQ